MDLKEEITIKQANLIQQINVYYGIKVNVSTKREAIILIGKYFSNNNNLYFEGNTIKDTNITFNKKKYTLQDAINCGIARKRISVNNIAGKVLRDFDNSFDLECIEMNKYAKDIEGNNPYIIVE